MTKGARTVEKKIALVLLAVLMLTGCSGQTAGKTSSTTTVPSTVPTTVTTTVPTTIPTTVPTTVPTTAPTTVLTTTAPTTTAAKAPTTKRPFVSTAPITVAPTIVPSVAPEPDNWVTEEGATYYLVDGQKATGWLDIGNARYYFGTDGAMHTGWLEFGGNRYFFHEDGRIAVGKVEVSEGEYHYFLKNGQEILIVNPWNYLPESYTVDTVKYTTNRYVAEICYEPLSRMIADCKKATGGGVVVRSAYRSNSDQVYLYENKVKYFMNKGLSRTEAELEAGKVVAIPGTSEHQLGFAVDLTDASYDKLNEKQEQMPVQKWFMEHCWEYGFILRYPNGKTEKTGIVYEPWHYRYVGVELAMEMKDSGLCLEEYLEQLTQE